MEKFYILVIATPTTMRFGVLTEPKLPDDIVLNPGELAFLIDPVDVRHGGHAHQIPQEGENNG